MKFENSPQISNLDKKEDEFEKQFLNKETIQVLDGAVEVVDIIPEKLEKEIPVLFASGWSNTPETYEDAMKIMNEKGRRVLGIKHDREGISEESIGNELQKEASEHPIEELRKAISILAVLDKKSISKIDVIAHSEGAINTAIAASIEPEKFNTIVFLNPAGMIGKDNFFKLAGRFSLNAIREKMKSLTATEVEKEHYKVYEKEQIDYIKANFSRANKESKAISEADIKDLIKELKASGIKVIIVAGVDDPGFPMDKIQGHAEADGLDGFISVQGGHIEIATHPEKFAPAIESLLSKNESNKQEITE